jgi:uncharacterized protein (TIGR03437 family)
MKDWKLLAAALSLLALAQQAPAVSFYRLRIEYSTTSDWTTLQLRNPASVYTVRLVSTENQPALADANVERLALNQSLSAAQAGQRVGMTVDYALAAEAIGQPLLFRLEKGSLNGSIVRVSVVTALGPGLLREVSHQGVVGSDGRNPLEFSIDLGPLSSIGPWQVPAPLAGPRMLWAFYYPWYYASSWSSALLRDHPAIPYASNDASAIARHIAEAQSAGIDGFISSWWGPDDYTDRNLKTLLDLAKERGFAVTIYFETLTGDPPHARAAEEIYRWLAYAISTYRDHPAFFRVNGRPLIVVWASESAPLATWQDVFTKLRAQGLEAVYLAMGHNAANLAVFDGLHDYGASDSPAAAEELARVGRATRYHHLLADSATPKIWAPSAQPGYDDRLIPGRQGSFKERRDGAYYRATFDAAIRSEPDWVFVMTWNEWWEHTYVEPSELYRDQYLKITREYAEKWKGKTIRRVLNAASYASGPVAPGQVVSLFGLGLGPEQAAGLQLDSSGRVANALAGTKVFFDGLPAPLLLAHTSQANAVVPYAVAGKSSTRVQVEYAGVKSNEVVLPAAAAAPGIFTLDSSGKGQSAILNEDQSVNSPYRPAARGSVVTLWATGEGQTEPAGVDGKVAAWPPPKPQQPVLVTIGGRPTEIRYAGGAPEMVAGVLQVNARVPEDAPAGLAVPVALKVGEASSQPGVTMAVESALAGEFQQADSAFCEVLGWVRNPDSPTPVNLGIYRDGLMGAGVFVAATAADRAGSFRYRFAGNSGLFEDREHAIYVYVSEASGNPIALLKGSPKTIRCGVNEAKFAAQTVPATMKAGGKHEVSISMQNTGTRTWLASSRGGAHRLGAQSPQDNRTWGSSRLELPQHVAPGETVTIRATVTAPVQPGAYSFQWRMVEDLVQWFGEFTPLVRVAVEGQ